LKPHKTIRQEIENLLGIVRRDLEDAATSGISDDWRFGIAYNATLKLCSNGCAPHTLTSSHDNYPNK